MTSGTLYVTSHSHQFQLTTNKVERQRRKERLVDLLANILGLKLSIEAGGEGDVQEC